MPALPLQNLEIRRFLQGRNGERIMLVVNLLLVAWIASALAKLVWGVIDQAEIPVITDTGTGNVPAAAPDPDSQLIRQLPELHLMGEATGSDEPVGGGAVPIDVPETRLKLVLHGSFATDTQEDALAIIADPKGKELHYSIGDTLPGNAELKEIYPDRVILMRNGRYETLRLPELREKSGTLKRASRINPEVSSRIREQRNVIKRSKSLYSIMRTSPMQADENSEDGKLLGYKLDPGRDKALFQELGLQAGDVVVQVNDIRLDTPQNGMEALKSVHGGDPVNLTILRDGIEQVMSFTLPDK